MFRLFGKNREAVKKYLLIFFLGIVSIGMVVTLAPIPTGDTGRMDANELASLGSYSITAQDLQREITVQFRRSPMGNDPRVISAMAPTVLEDMIMDRALLRQAEKMHLGVSDEELRTRMRAIPWLFQDGAFVGMDRYPDMVTQFAGMPVAQFEEQLRESIMEDKIRYVVTDGIQVPPSEVHEEFLRRNAKAKIEAVVFDPSQYLKTVEVTPQALGEFFKKDAGRYKVPAERQVKYVIVDADHVRAQLKLSDEDIRQAYMQHLSDYRVPERVKVAHILFKTTGKTPAEVSALEKKAQEVLAQIKAGGDFAELAKKNSEDSTAANGGDLGWIVRGQTVKEFEQAAFSMKPGQISDLIKTAYGIHILKVGEKQEAHLQTFDEVKGALRADLEKTRIEDLQQKTADRLAQDLKKTPQQFDALARQAGLEPRESVPFKFNQAVPDLGNSEALENLAFQLRLDEVGTPITVPKGLAIIQLSKIIPEHDPKLEEVTARVEEDYRAEQSKVVAVDKAKQFAAQCKTGDFKKLAQAQKLTVKESKDFTEREYVEGIASGSQLAAAFTLNPGQTSDVVFSGTNSVVFRVISHTPADEADFAKQRDQIAEELAERKRNLAFQIFRQNLKQQLVQSKELKINDAAFKQFLASYQK